MEVQSRPAPECVRWAGRFAGHIHDPVLRLRFLRAVVRIAAQEPAHSPRRSVRIPHVLLTLLVAAVCGLALLFRMAAKPPRAALPADRAIPRAAVLPAKDTLLHGLPAIWQVESAGGSETYSNGLRIDNRFAVANRPRTYVVFPAEPGREERPVPRTEPAGIVFHTTESPQAPFEARENGVLKRIGESLLDYVRGKRAYHFLIDRFGRVYRVVQESDVAFHAGYSVWADDRWLYVNLNESFLAVAFEADTAPGQMDAAINPAQVRAAADLTALLRSRYALPAGNCVTHAMVSVNPANMRIGYHTDWASSFPFEQLGLPDNYSRALPAMARFGFEYDPAFLRQAGTRLYTALELAKKDLEAHAAGSGLPVAVWRKRLQGRYRVMLATVRRGGDAARPE
jgi:hypothetical protein